jgi:hypothetical protein
MLKVIEQAVFNGASKAFAQFSNGPSAAKPEFLGKRRRDLCDSGRLGLWQV